MWFIGVEVEQETSAPPPKKNPGSAIVACLNESANRSVCYCVMRYENFAVNQKSFLSAML